MEVKFSNASTWWNVGDDEVSGYCQRISYEDNSVYNYLLLSHGWKVDCLDEGSVVVVECVDMIDWNGVTSVLWKEVEDEEA